METKKLSKNRLSKDINNQFIKRLRLQLKIQLTERFADFFLLKTLY